MAIAGNLRLKDVLDGDLGQQNLYAIIEAEKNKIKNKIKKKKISGNLEDLQRRLNYIFYPKGGSVSTIAEEYRKNIGERTMAELGEAIEKFNFEEKYSNQKYQKDHSYIELSTLSKELDNLNKIYETLLNSLPNEKNENLEKKLKEIEKKYNDGRKFLKEVEDKLSIGKHRIYKDHKKFNESLLLINQIQALSNVVENNGTGLVTPQEAGEEFEKALALTNYIGTTIDIVITDSMKEIANTFYKKGDKSVLRGNEVVHYSINPDFINENYVEDDPSFKINKKNLEISYNYFPGEKKQGKLDVLLIFDGESIKDVRVSAKRWKKGKGDLGETSIDAGLTRTSGLTVAEAYKLAVLQPKKDNLDIGEENVPEFKAADIAHQMAQYAIKADIAMGISQKENYANVLVVDTGHSIVVKDLAEIVEKNPLAKYNIKDINDKAIANYNFLKMGRGGRTESYLANMTSVLNKMKVTMYVNANT